VPSDVLPDRVAASKIELVHRRWALPFHLHPPVVCYASIRTHRGPRLVENGEQLEQRKDGWIASGNWTGEETEPSRFLGTI
jgi:hypothetical protein